LRLIHHAILRSAQRDPHPAAAIKEYANNSIQTFRVKITEKEIATDAGRAVALRKYLPRAFVIAGLIATPAFAADQPPLPPFLAQLTPTASPIPDVEYFAPHPIPAWQAEFAGRYWYASATTGKSLYGPPSLLPSMVSRLTYRNLVANSGELYGRVAASNGWFLKGYVGLGTISQGSLQDEDFPPLTVPYSSTTSDQHNGYLSYATVDVGYDLVRGGDFNFGAFVGYHILNETVNAYGCTQTAGNPGICQPAIPTAAEVISQNNIWQSPRVGVDGSVKFGDRFKLSADAAWLPYVILSGADTHWVRIAEGDFSGPIPEDGTGQGYQMEALLSYNVTQTTSLGVGARYWHMQTNGNSHFENVAVGGLPQPVDWKTDIFGVFVQASFKFGPYPLSIGMN